GGMASGRTCPHGDADRLQVSGTQLRKWLSEGRPVPAEFSRPEVLEILRDEIDTALVQLGRPSIASIDRSLVV
ncbi:MAG TPA: hypothetical protein PKC19_17860, partial [Roseiflexaceae bacterium]|nr:hypothetical protein [Roseiflexaceae bacterium]